jgi:hypothetical protein
MDLLLHAAVDVQIPKFLQEINASNAHNGVKTVLEEHAHAKLDYFPTEEPALKHAQYMTLSLMVQLAQNVMLQTIC